MNEKTAEALEASIKHWEENLELAKTDQLTARNIGLVSCALCHLFVAGQIDVTNCDGCPVKVRAGVPGCQHTPWVGVAYVLDTNDTMLISEAVEAELNFLKSLREEQP